MFNIRIVNLRNYVPKENEVLIRVDRTTVLGNPFYMRNETERDAVCDKYEVYFNTKLGTDKKFVTALRDIYYSAKTQNVALGCWCFPKRCHAETIKRFIENMF